MTNAGDATTPGPYARAVGTYWSNGWRGLLPLPYGKKTPVPTGYTGADGSDPSFPDVQAWADGPEGAGNIALRLPPDVIGVDVDAYGGKPARLVLDELEKRLGHLPTTWRSTSRDDGTSGIRLYKVPPGLRWPGGLGPGIDVLRHGHRYALVWPSVHPEGGTYRWITPDGATALDQIPDADNLPHLPDEWVAHFTGGEIETDQPRAHLDDTAAAAWLNSHGDGHPCRRIDRALSDALNSLPAATSRHDAVLTATNRIIWLAGEHHPGALHALSQLRGAFLTATAGDRDVGEAEAEWARMVAGAVRLSAARELEHGPDPCDDPFHDLTPKEQPCPSPAPSNASPTPSNSSSSSPNASPPTDATTTTPPTSGPTTPPEARERTTWWPLDLDRAIHGEPEPPPAHLARDDGHAALYAGRVNGVIGPSESGKTWVALHAVRQALDTGQAVTFLDFEDSDKGVVRRLLNLGVDPELIRQHLAYINPAERYAAFTPSGIDLAEHLTEHQPALIVLDGFNASMSLQGLNLLDNMDATLYFQTLLKPLSTSGATVLYVDHTPKNNGENASAGGIGAQAKRAMTTGCTLKVDVIKAFGVGQSGKLRLYVDKDRQGDVRGVSLQGKSGHWFGDFAVTGHPDSTLHATVTAPEGYDAEHPEAYEFRPTGLMQKVSAWLAEQGEPVSLRAVIKDAGLGRQQYVKTALELLVEEGYVERSEATGRGGKRHAFNHARAYTEVAELASSPSRSEVSPTVSQVSPGDGSEDTPAKCLHHPPSLRGVETLPRPSDDHSETGQKPEVSPATSERRTTTTPDGVTYDIRTGEVVDA